MGTHRDGRKEAVRLWVEISEERCNIKTVYEESSATAAPCVLEQMEKLYSAGIRLHEVLSKRKKPIVNEKSTYEIRVVRVRGQSEVRIRRVTTSHVSGKVPKLPI
jgi:hypothetical protein